MDTKSSTDEDGVILRFQKKMCFLFVNFPEFMFGLGLFFMLAITCIAAPSIQLSDSTPYDWTVTTSTESKYQDITTDLLRKIDSVHGSSNVEKERSLPFPTSYLKINYESNIPSSNSFFTPASIQAMCEIESILWNMKEYQTSFCILTDDMNNQIPGTNCSIPSNSLVPVFYKWRTTKERSCKQLNPAAIPQNIESKVRKFFLGKRSQDKKFNTTDITRSYLVLGGPLKGFKNMEDRKSEQLEMYKGFAKKWEQNIFDFFKLNNSFSKSAYRSKAAHGPVSVRFINALFTGLEFNRVVNSDLAWTMASVTFVFIYIAVHTGSLFLAIVALTQILLSIPISYFAYRYIFDVPFFTQLHILTIFLVLGVGADDVFVLSDAWKQADAHPQIKNQIFERLLHTYNLAFFAIFNTSFTTAMAFMSTAFSPIMPISAFGIFAATAILINYFYVILFTPSALIIYYKYFDHREVCGCPSSKKRNDFKKVSLNYVTEVNLGDIHHEIEIFHSQRDVDLKSGLVNKIFNGVFTDCINNKVFAFCVILGFVGYFIQALYFTALLEPPDSEEEWFSSDHMWTGIGDYTSNAFLAGPDDNYVKATITWGAKDISRPNFSKWKPDKNRGDVVFNDLFDISSKDTHDFLLRTCDMLNLSKCALKGCMDGSGMLIRPNTLECWIKDMKSFFNNSLPTQDLFIPALKKFVLVNKEHATSIGFVENELKFVRFKMTLTLLKRQPYSKTNPIILMVRNIENDLNSKSPKPLGSSFIDAGRSFVWAQTEKGLVDGMYNGLAICFPVAFAVLIFATGNIITSLFAILSIASIVFSVLGFCYLFLGWSLGTAESIAAVIVIGFSVDYVVHLGHVYQESLANSRHGKVAEALRIMAPTVLAGAMTTMGAGLFMCGCQMVFFTKMAVLITLTISFSLAYALLFFMCMLSQFGPEGTIGSIENLVRSTKNEECTIDKKTHPVV